MTHATSETQVRRCLEDGEILIWAGRPDIQAFLNGIYMTSFGTGTRFLNTPLTRRIIMSLFFAAVIAISISWIVKNDILMVVNFSDINSAFAGIVIVLFTFGAVRIGQKIKGSSWKGREQDYAESLTYGITDQRILILRDGVIEEEFTVAEVHPKVFERKNAPGFGDIIWGRKERTSGISTHGDSISRFTRPGLSTLLTSWLTLT